MNDSPIIVGGCHRSGTTLVRRILDAHPRISCLPEVKFMLDFHGDLRDDPHAHARQLGTARRAVGDDAAFEIYGAAFLEMHRRAAREAEKPRWADKNPENVLYLDAWERLLGDDWTLLHVVRDPRDAVASMQEAGFPLGRSGDTAGDRARHWRRYVDAGRAFGREHPDRYVEVAYEELVGAPEREVPALMRRLGEEFDPVQLRLNGNGNGNGSRAGLEDPKAQGRTRIEAGGVGRWREDLDPDDAGEVMESVAERRREGEGGPEITVTAYPDGPYLVRGPVTVLDDEGNEIPLRRRTIALCRCGRSRMHPFCDGTHKRIDFRAPGSSAFLGSSGASEEGSRSSG